MSAQYKRRRLPTRLKIARGVKPGFLPLAGPPRCAKYGSRRHRLEPSLRRARLLVPDRQGAVGVRSGRRPGRRAPRIPAVGGVRESGREAQSRARARPAEPRLPGQKRVFRGPGRARGGGGRLGGSPDEPPGPPATPPPRLRGRGSEEPGAAPRGSPCCRFLERIKLKYGR